MISDSFKKQYEKELKEIEELKGEFLDLWMFRLDMYLGNVNAAKKFYSSVNKKPLSKEEEQQQLKTIEESYNARKEMYGKSWTDFKKTLLSSKVDDAAMWMMYPEYNYVHNRLGNIVGEFYNYDSTINDRGLLHREIADYMHTVEKKFKRAIAAFDPKMKMPDPVTLPTTVAPVSTPKKSVFSRFFSRGGKRTKRRKTKRR